MGWRGAARNMAANAVASRYLDSSHDYLLREALAQKRPMHRPFVPARNREVNAGLRA